MRRRRSDGQALSGWLAGTSVCRDCGDGVPSRVVDSCEHASDKSATLKKMSFHSQVFLPLSRFFIEVSPCSNVSLALHEPEGSSFRPHCLHTLCMLYGCRFVPLTTKHGGVATGGGYTLPKTYARVCKIKSTRPVRAIPCAIREDLRGQSCACLPRSMVLRSPGLTVARLRPPDGIK